MGRTYVPAKFSPAWKGQPKALEIFPARKPVTGGNVSGVVLVYPAGGGTWKSYIRYNREAERVLGEKVPYGVGPEDQGFLKVAWNGYTYEVRFCYVGDPREILLWTTASLPEWCANLRPALTIVN